MSLLDQLRQQLNFDVAHDICPKKDGAVVVREKKQNFVYCLLC